MQGKLRAIRQVSLALVLALALIITACSGGDGSNDTATVTVLPFHLMPMAGGSFGGGAGTPGNPYIIEDVADLQAMKNNLTAYYALAGDIDASATSGWNAGQGFVPVGDATNRFSGGLDGGGFTITELYINRPATNNVGLFGHVGDDTGTTVIRNVSLIDTTVIGARGTGTLIGRVTGNANTLIENCSAVGGTVTGNGATGGLIGSFNSWRTTPGGDDNPILRYSYTDVAVYSSASGGGRDKFGGLVGCSQKGTIQNSYSRSSVTVTDGSRIGGLAGCVDIRGEILNSYSTGPVNVTNCTSFGGLVGNRVGPGFNVGVVTNSFWDTETSGQATSDGGTGKSTDDMRLKDTFTDAGWNFDDVWSIDPGVNDGYPYLVWQDFEPAVLTIAGTFTADNRTYDGTNNASGDTDSLVLSGVLGSDDVTLVNVVIRFEDPHAATGKTVYITSAALAGPDAGKYILSLLGAPTTTADITRKGLTITADDKTKVYSGTAFPYGDFTIIYDGFVAGEGPGNLGGELVFSGTAIPAINVGTYVITPSGLTSDNYDITFEPGTLTLDPRPITVTANDQTKFVNQTFAFDHDEYEITAGSLVSGHTLTLVLSSDGAAAGAAVGDYVIDISDLVIMDNGTNVTDNYDITQVEGTFTVTGLIILTITGEFTAQDKTYDGTRDAQSVTDSLTLDGVEPGDIVTLVDVVIRFADPYAGDDKTVYVTSAALSGEHAYKYALSLAGAPTTTASIIPLTIEVTAHEKAKVYGAADPALTYEYSPNLVGSDTFIGALTRIAGEDVGTHEIQQGSLALSSNYVLDYTSANLTITPLTVYVTAHARSKTYGAPDPVLTYAFYPAPLPFGDSFTGQLTRAAGEAVGTYAIKQGTLALSSNYILNYSGNYLTITPLTVYVTAHARSKTYGAPDPVLTYAFYPAPLPFGDSFTGQLTRAAGEAVGTYEIQQGTLALSGNYILNYIGNYLTITRRVTRVPVECPGEPGPPPQPAPHGFAGTVSVIDPPGSVPQGTLVEAYVNGARTASASVDDQSWYVLMVPGTSGATVTFWVGGVMANETAAWVSARLDEPFDLTVEALPAAPYTLTTSSTAGGSVTVPGEGMFSRGEDTVVNLVATPDEGYRFVNWTGDTGTIASGNASSTTITMNGNYSITASFEKEQEDESPSPAPVASSCFIATAAYGSPTAEQVDVLREFRDVVLLESTAGSRFVALYYRFSPPAADFIAENGLVRTFVRVLLVDAVVRLVETARPVWHNQ